MQLLTRVGLSYGRRTAGNAPSIDNAAGPAGIDDRSAQASLDGVSARLMTPDTSLGSGLVR